MMFHHQRHFFIVKDVVGVTDFVGAMDIEL